MLLKALEAAEAQLDERTGEDERSEASLNGQPGDM